MRVLHLFSNAKWTGPAEPALNLCVALRRHGIEADFACAPDAGESVNKVVETARDRGIEPILRFHLAKHRNPFTNLLDRIALAAFLRENRYDVVHCHLDNDHRIALGPAGRHQIPLVRSSYEGTGFAPTRGRARLLSGAAFIIEPSQRALDHDVKMYRLCAERLRVIPGAVDLERFDPSREVPDARRWVGIPHDAFVVGIVARLQRHRRFEDFFRAIRMLVDRCPQAHVIVVGRGTRQQQVAGDPVRELGLVGHVHFPGYVDGENYVGTLKAFSAFVYLVPGSDGTCRAVREAMSMGKPAIVADRGMLPEIVDHDKTGIVFDGSPEALYEVLSALCADPARVRALGRAAREKAHAAFSLDAQAHAVAEVYQHVVADSRRTSRTPEEKATINSTSS